MIFYGLEGKIRLKKKGGLVTLDYDKDSLQDVRNLNGHATRASPDASLMASAGHAF